MKLKITAARHRERRLPAGVFVPSNVISPAGSQRSRWTHGSSHPAENRHA